jgi:hypothetical protein
VTTIRAAHFVGASIRTLDCHGDNWYATWAADDTQLVALCDGVGVPGNTGNLYNSRLLHLTGHPESGMAFEDMGGYPDLSVPIREVEDDGNPRYYGFGTVAIGKRIYQYLSTWNIPMTDAGVETGNLRFNGAKLIYSDDSGLSWRNQDGSEPVRWERWDQRSRDTMVFFDEPGECFSLPSVLQMGQAYELNTDGYVYIYAPNGNVEGSMNQLVLCRVGVDEVVDRSAYEYFSGTDSSGNAVWSAQISLRQPVLTFPSGWVNRNSHPYAWQPFVVYNAPLGLYLMSSWATGLDSSGTWFGSPSYLGLYQAETPWGPWECFHEEREWVPGGDRGARCYQAVIMPKWISADGRTIWLAWTDYQNRGSEQIKAELEEMKSSDVPTEEYMRRVAAQHPAYRFNIQRVELSVAEQ